MKLISFPDDFSPLLADNYFHFEEADPEVSTEIFFYSDEGEPLGARRYAGRAEIDTSPRAFVQRTLDPEPVERGAMRIFQPSGRQVGLSVAVGADGEPSPVVMFAANVLPLLSSSLLGSSEQRRVMTLEEFDEVSMLLTGGDSVSVECCGADGTQPTPLTFTCPQSGLYTLTFTAEELCARVGLGESGGRVDVRVMIDGATKGLLHYNIIPAAEGDRRVAWLDVYGAIRHYTFTQLPVERLEVARSESDTLRGTRTLSVESWKRTSLRTGPLSNTELDYIKGLICSPRVWLREGERWVACSITDSLCRCGQRDTMSLEVTLRPSQKTTLW